jgi:hypothetical protein
MVSIEKQDCFLSHLAAYEIIHTFRYFFYTNYSLLNDNAMIRNSKPGKKITGLFIGILLFAGISSASEKNEAEEQWKSIFNGRDFSGWTVPVGDNGHWQVVDGIIDYDAMSEAAGSKDLWTEKEYGDFVLRIDWRLKDTPFINPNVPIIRPDGTHQKNAQGEEITISVPDADSGIFLRGSSKAQVNIWAWPTGSGEVYGYRMDRNMPAEVRAGVTPKLMADNHIGEWNTFEITMKGDLLTVVLNGKTVIENAQLPGVPEKGKIALQHHGSMRDGKWTSSPSLIQFRNISIKEL